MKHIKNTHKELRNKAADAFWQSRRARDRGYKMNQVWEMARHHALCIAALEVKNAIFREKCAKKGIDL